LTRRYQCATASPVIRQGGIVIIPEAKASSTISGYRADIDGLRGVAILLVVAYHVRLPFFHGGYLGVDIFFVISGFLITRQLLGEQERSGRIGITGFYARRVRRLFPALILVVVATLAGGFLLLLPDEQVALARSAVMSLLFAANIHFWQAGTGYFEAASVLMPLKHLWTLGVEEQFYVAWPLAFASLVALSRRRGWRPPAALSIALAAILLLSLGLSIVLGASRAAFFLIPARAWELAAGCLLAFAPPLGAGSARWLGLIGGAAIIAAVVALDPQMTYSSWHSLLPVAGSAAIVAAGPAYPDAPVQRLLSMRWLVWIGTISYGWYLLHWPLLSFARILSGGGIHWVRDTALVLLALVLAAAMHRWVETPVRLRRVVGFRSNAGTMASGCALLAAGLALGGALWAWAAQPSPAGSLLAQYREARRGAARDFPFCDGALPCEFGAPRGSPALLLWGDSHAAQLVPALDVSGRQAGVRIIVRTKGSCSPGGSPAGVRAGNPDWIACAAFLDRARREIPALQRRHPLRAILFAGGWDAAQTGWDRVLAADIDMARRGGLRVVIARDVPLHSRNFFRCATVRGVAACAEPRTQIAGRAAATDRAVDAIAASRPDVVIWSPLDALCPAAHCPAAIDGRLLYRNHGHLTLAGAARLRPAVMPILSPIAGPAIRR